MYLEEMEMDRDEAQEIHACDTADRHALICKQDFTK